MSVLSEADIWTLTLRLLASYRGSRPLLEIPPDAVAKMTAPSGSRFITLAGKIDSLNKMPEIDVRGNAKGSVLTLDEAPVLPGWSGSFRTGQLFTSMRIIAGKSRQVWFYIPDVDIPQPLGPVVSPDGETWLDHLDICVAADVAINNGRIAPVAAPDIDNTNGHKHTEVPSGRSKLMKDIAGHLLPMIHVEQPQRQWVDRLHTTLAGQSLGGTSVLMGARYAPETFDLVFSHSPSMWWAPEGTSRPGLSSETDISQVSEHLPSVPP